MPTIHADTDYNAQRTLYLEQRCKRLESENDLLRTAMLTHADASNKLMNVYLTSKTWHENGCPGPGDKTHDAMRKAFDEARGL